MTLEAHLSRKKTAIPICIFKFLIEMDSEKREMFIVIVA
jgi:hypothetical protein